MKPRTFVLIVSNQSLMGDILENLLGGNRNLLVHRTTPCLYKRVLQDVAGYDSFVVVIEKEAFDGTLSEMVRQIGRCHRLHLIIVSSESDEIVVYTSEYTNHADRIILSGAASLALLVNAFAGQPPERRNVYTAVAPLYPLFKRNVTTAAKA